MDTNSYLNILHLTIGGDNSVWGDRTPAVWLFRNKGFLISSAISGNYNNDKLIYPPTQAGKWMHFEISQILTKNKV